MELNDLYKLAENRGHKVYRFAFKDERISSASVLTRGGDCDIAIDPNKLEGELDEKIKLSHELGHCVTGSFYNCYATCDLRKRHECRAKHWQAKELIPRESVTRRYSVSSR